METPDGFFTTKLVRGPRDGADSAAFLQRLRGQEAAHDALPRRTRASHLLGRTTLLLVGALFLSASAVSVLANPPDGMTLGWVIAAVACLGLWSWANWLRRDDRRL